MTRFKPKFLDFTGKRGKVNMTLAVASLFVLLVHWLAVFIFIIPRLGTLTFLRLHYTAALGVDWIAEWWKVFVFPVFGLFVFFVNAYLSGLLQKQHKSLGAVGFSATLVTEIALAIGGISAVLLNI